MLKSACLKNATCGALGAIFFRQEVAEGDRDLAIVHAFSRNLKHLAVIAGVGSRVGGAIVNGTVEDCRHPLPPSLQLLPK